MVHFVSYSNNGVTALLTEEDWQRLKEDRPLKTGYFLFFQGEDQSRPGEPWFHGNTELMEQLLQGHSVTRAFMYVPFSNGIHMLPDRESLLGEIILIASSGKLLEMFGLTPGKNNAHQAVSA